MEGDLGSVETRSKLRGTMNILGDIKCFFGYHDFINCSQTTQHGFVFGGKCSRCGLWSDDRVSRAWTEDELEEFYLDDGHH